jgi:hypothetical protein
MTHVLRSPATAWSFDVLFQPTPSIYVSNVDFDPHFPLINQTSIAGILCCSCIFWTQTNDGRRLAMLAKFSRSSLLPRVYSTSSLAMFIFSSSRCSLQATRSNVAFVSLSLEPQRRRESGHR